MSAFLVTNKHINVILTAYNDGLYPGEKLSADELTELGYTLLRENQRSVNYRYGARNRVGRYRYQPVYLPEHNAALAAVKLLHSLRYQSCERPDYEKSAAYKLYIKLLNSITMDLPDYETAPWSV